MLMKVPEFFFFFFNDFERECVCEREKELTEAGGRDEEANFPLSKELTWGSIPAPWTLT